jgi:hypothetical protein
MELPSTYRMLVTGGIMSAATVFRTGIGCAELLARRAPGLMQLSAHTQDGSARDAAAQARFRDELIALARDSSELALREIRRGIEDLDSFTRPGEDAEAVPERRFYKAKP